MIEFRTRSKSHVLNDLVEKLRSLPQNHPDRPHLIRMVLDLSREIGRSGQGRCRAEDFSARGRGSATWSG